MGYGQESFERTYVEKTDLKGRVKSVVEEGYSVIKNDSIRGSSWERKYNETGRLTYEEIRLGQLATITEYEYNATGTIAEIREIGRSFFCWSWSRVSVYDANERLREVIEECKEDPGSVEDKIYTKYTYVGNDKVIKTISECDANGIVKNKYTEPHLLSFLKKDTYEQDDSDGDSDKDSRYIYEKYDSHGNWIQARNKDDASEVCIRRIEYY